MNILKLFINNNFSFRILAANFMLFVLIMLSSKIYGQTAELSLSRDSISPGQHSELILQVDAPRDHRIVFPVLSDTITADIEIISYKPADTIIAGDEKQIIKRYVITAWDDGFFPIPPVAFVSFYEGDTVFFESNASLLGVSAVDVDIAQGVRDIKPIFRLPVTFAELFPYILGALVAASGIFLLVRYLKRRKKTQKTDSIWEKPEIPAHIAAISSLEKLRKQKLWQNGKVKVYHTELTMILRFYLEKRFDINAPEMTSVEIIKSMEPLISNHEMLRALAEILEQADLVKFAKHLPEAAENEKAVDMSIEFVKFNIPSRNDVAAEKVNKEIAGEKEMNEK